MADAETPRFRAPHVNANAIKDRGRTTHAMSVTKSRVETVTKHAEQVGASRVCSLYLHVGFARGIVDKLLDNCFGWMARGTICKGAQLVIERIPLTVRCNDCGGVYHLDVHDEGTWHCPFCGSKHYKLNTGMEFMITGIECAFSDQQIAVGAEA